MCHDACPQRPGLIIDDRQHDSHTGRIEKLYNIPMIDSEQYCGNHNRNFRPDPVFEAVKDNSPEHQLFTNRSDDTDYQDHQSHGLSAKCFLRNLTVTRKQIIQMNHLDKIVKELSYRNRKDNHTEPDNRRCPHEILSVSTESLFPSLLIFSVKQIQNNTSRHISDQSHIQGTL